MRMKKLVKGLAITIAIVVAAITALLVTARFSDGPLEIISGGPFTSGELAVTPLDWNFLKERSTLEFQTMKPATSRTVWLAVHEGRLFIVSGYMTTGYGKVWKQWPHYLADDNRILLRVDGKLYEQRMQRIMTGPEVVPVLNEMARKYGTGEQSSAEEVEQGHVWMFEVVGQRPSVTNLDSANWGPPGGGNGVPVGVRTASLGVDPANGGVSYYARFPSGSHFDLHWHTHDEFVAVLQGRVTLVLGEQSHDLFPGSYSVIPGSINHSWDVPVGEDVIILVRRSGPADFHFVET